jgi:hypothetical protein
MVQVYRVGVQELITCQALLDVDHPVLARVDLAVTASLVAVINMAAVRYLRAHALAQMERQLPMVLLEVTILRALLGVEAHAVCNNEAVTMVPYQGPINTAPALSIPALVLVLMVPQLHMVLQKLIILRALLLVAEPALHKHALALMANLVVHINTPAVRL